MQIRDARREDAIAIGNLLAQLGYPGMDEIEVAKKINLHTLPGYRLLVAEDKNQVVGFISLHCFELMHWKGRLGRITAFCIEESFRSMGLGTQLLKASEDYFSSLGCVKFEVTSNARRTLTHGFYLKNGYVEDSRRFVKYIH